MDNKTKLLAEQALYNAAARFFEEPDSVELAQINESKDKDAAQLDEKMVNATLPDGRVITVDDEDYESIADASADEYLGDVPPEDRPAPVAKYTGAASKAAAKAAATARSTANFGTRSEAGQELFNTQVKPALDAMIKKVADVLVKTGRITYDEEGQYWEVALDFPKLRAIQAENLWPVFKDATAGLGKIERDKALAAYKAYLGHQANLGGANDYSPLKRMLKADAVAAAAPAEEAPVEAAPAPAPKKKRSKKVKVESAFVNDLFKAINEALAAEYAERYNVSLDEASSMFIVNDTLMLEE